MRVIAATAIVVALAGTATAQDDRAHWARLAQQNQAGLLTYCAAQGHIKAPVGPAPPGPAEPDVAAAGLAGQSGVIRYVDPQATLAESAAASGTTVAYRCQLMGLGVR